MSTSETRQLDLDSLARRYNRGVRAPDGTLRLSEIDRLWLENVARAGVGTSGAPLKSQLGRPADFALLNPAFMRNGRYRMRPSDVNMAEWNLTVLQASRIAGCVPSQLAALAMNGWVPAVPVVSHGDVLWRFRAAEVEVWSYDGHGVAPRSRAPRGPTFICRDGTILGFPRGYR